MNYVVLKINLPNGHQEIKNEIDISEKDATVLHGFFKTLQTLIETNHKVDRVLSHTAEFTNAPGRILRVTVKVK